MEYSAISSREEIFEKKYLLISLKPKYANQIFAGSKGIEFRRAWPSCAIAGVVVYVTSPVKKICGIFKIREVKKATFSELWNLSGIYGGGVSYEELSSYLKGRQESYGIIIHEAYRGNRDLQLGEISQDISAPQSYRFLSKDQYKLICSKGSFGNLS